MKLKNILVITFLTLTLIPIITISLLLYKSGFELSKESYTRNLVESINVQVDYISQTIEGNMINDYRFANNNYISPSATETEIIAHKHELRTAFQTYLESSEDKIAATVLLDKDNVPLYTIGEKAVLDTITSQYPDFSKLEGQKIMEFDLGQEIYSLGIVTPVWDSNRVYAGSLISVYDKSYIFKIISSYYKIADTSTYICRENGGIINSRMLADEKQNNAITKTLDELTFYTEGVIERRVDNIPVLGYHKNINNSPWFLVGFIDEQLIYSFTNQFVLFYILIIAAVLIADVILSFYFSQKVVAPINRLIKVMEGYQNNLQNYQLQSDKKNGYFETHYLQTKFLDLMKTISMVQHNFKGIYELYQSSEMSDTNINIDVKKQTIQSSKDIFQKLMYEIEVPDGACIVERFCNCFCEKDRILLTDMFETMRDEHLAVTREAEIFTPYMGERWFHTLVVPMYQDDRLSHLFVQLRDISNFKKQEFHSSEQARRDPLTGLYNRTGFTECVADILQSKGQPDSHGLLFIDMDYFKLVNDNLGHKAGDELLCSVAQTLLDTVEHPAIASRFGGDEFALFIPHSSTDKILEMKDKLNKLLIYPFQTEETTFVVSASIGVSIWTDTSSDTLEEMLQKADSSMYQAKREFKQHTPG